MTRDEVMAMVPGQAMDAVVAEVVLGWKKVRYGEASGRGNWFLWHDGDEQWAHFGGERMLCVGNDLPKFSTDIAVAWKLIETEFGNPHGSTGKRFHFHLDEGVLCGWSVDLWDERKAVRSIPPGQGWTGIRVYADTAPEAICKAAIIACLEGGKK